MINNYNSLGSGRDTWLKTSVVDSVGLPPTSNTKFKWFAMLLMFLFVTLGQQTFAQSTANYVFSTNTTGSLIDASGTAVDMSTGTTQLVGPLSDATISSVATIGFNYVFMGNSFSQFSVNADGILGLGATALSSGTAPSGGTASAPRLSACGGDFYVGASGKVHYKLVGVAPNRCLVVEWTNMAVTYNTTASNADSTWQVRLYESSNVVEYVYGTMNCTSTTFNPAYTGFSTGTILNTTASITYATNALSNGATFNSNTLVLGSIANLNSFLNGTRRVYKFTPPTVVPASPITFATTLVTFSGTTLNWVDNSTEEALFSIKRATDPAFTQNVVVTNVASTSTATTGTAYTSLQSGLSAGTTYYYSIQSSTEGQASVALSGSQATLAGATYYWVGASGSTLGLATNWNTAADGTGTGRTTPTTTDILIVDGAGTTPGVATLISVDVASFTIGQLKITSNTACNLQSSATTLRLITISGGGGDDFVIDSGSTLNLVNTLNPVAFAFSGSANAGDISGTLNFAGSTSNAMTTTGGTGTLVSVKPTGVVNLGATGNSLVGSVATLSFANGSNCNSTGATTGAPPVPLATWGASSNLTITGITTSTTGPTNNNQSFGNLTYNCPLATATMSFFTSTTTAVVKGDLNITAGATGGTGIFRALTTGTLNVTGNVIVNQGRLQSNGTSGSFIANGNTTINANGILDILASTYSQRGAIFTNNGVLTGPAGTLGFINFTGSFAQTLAGTGTVLTNIAGLSVQNTAGLTISHANTITTLRANLFQGVVTGSDKLTLGTGATLSVFSQMGSNGLLTQGGSFTTSPTYNLGTGTYTVIYAGETVTRTTGTEIPPSRTVGVIQVGNTNNVTVAGGNINTGTLTLAGGKLITTDTNLMTVTGGSVSSVVRAGYVSGATSTSSGSIVTVVSTTGLIEGMLVSVTAGTGAFAPNTRVISVLNTTSFSVSTAPTTALSAATVSGIGAWVDGPLAVNLPASLVTGSTYNFPVGKSNINAFALVNPTTNAGGVVTVKAEVFDAATGGSAGSLIDNIASSRYWAASITGGSANFTSSLIQLNDATTGRDAIAGSATLTGAYGLQGGVAITTTPTSLTSTAPANTSLPGFFVMASKAAASLSALAITPTGNACTNVTRTVTVNVTPGGAAVTGVVINYAINGVAQTAITMTNTTLNGGLLLDTWSGVIPTVTPVNANVTWSVTATDANSLTKNLAGTGYNDEPLFGSTATATASVTNICAVGSSVLTANLLKPGSASLGAGATTSALAGSSIFSGAWGGQKTQYIVRASELLAAGVTAGSINSLAFEATTAFNGYEGFALNIGQTAATVAALPMITTGLTQVYTGAGANGSYATTIGVNTLPFSTPFLWDGVSNVVLSFCWSKVPNAGSTTGTTLKGDTVSFVSTVSGQSDNTAPSAFCPKFASADFGTSSTSSVRPKFTFAGNFAPAITSVLWSDGSTGTTVTVSPTVTTPYSAIITAAGCTATTNTVTVNVVPLPTAPALGVTTSTCGTKIPLVSVTDPNAFVTPTYKWYADNVITTALQTSTSATYTTAISVTTDFYVSVINPATGCESTRTLVTATVVPADTIDAIANKSVCLGSSFSATATSLNANYVYTWTATPVTGSGIATSLTGASQTITPTALGTFTYTVTATDGNCDTVTTFTATVNALPVISSVSATPAILCLNAGVSTLTATLPSALANYSFAASAGTYAPITGTLVGAGAIGDDVGVGNLPIGFSFNYNGTAQTVFGVSSNGLILLGNTTPAITGLSGNSLATNANVIAPLWDDNNTTGGSVIYATTGTAPNRTLTVQWTDMHVAGGGSSTTPTISIQAILNENGTIQIVYGPRSAALSSPAASVGVSGAVATYRSVTPLTPIATSTVSSSVENTSVTDVNLPVGSTLTFSPPVGAAIVWSPTTGLYTDAAALIPYTGTSAATVYAKPTTAGANVYTATATNAAGCPITATTAVTINTDPIADISATSTTMCLGGSTVTFSTPTLITNWVSSNTAVATIDNATGIVTAVSAGTTVINAQIVNTITGCTTVANNPQTVTVYTPVAIASQPTNIGVTGGAAASFAVATTGAVVSYQWKVSIDSGLSYNNVPLGAPYSTLTTGNTNTLSISSAPLSFNGYLYLCEVTAESPCASPVTSNIATLTVENISIGGPNPLVNTICPNGSGTVTFSVTTAGPTPDEVYWEIFDVPTASWNTLDALTVGTYGSLTWTGETTNTLVLSGVTIANNAWKVRASASVFIPLTSVTSNDGLITVNIPAVVTTQPANQTVCYSGGTTTFATVATGAIGYQWEYSSDGTSFNPVVNNTPVGVTYTNATTASLGVATTALTPALGTKFYRVVLTSPTGCANVDSANAELIITTPAITASASASVICNPGGAAVTLTGSGAGVGGTYTWLPTTGITGTGAVVTANPTVTTTYTVTGTTVEGCAKTATVTVTVAPILVPTATASPATVCSGLSSQLLATSGLDVVASAYCTPTAGIPGATGDYLASVSFGGIVNPSGEEDPLDFTDFTAQTANVVAGVANPVTIVGNDANQRFRVWIDFNKNGTFEASESVFTSIVAPTATGTITIPTTALNGTTRMRVACRYLTSILATEACGHAGFGEFEDYTVNITGATNAPTYTYAWSPSTYLSSTTIANPLASGVTSDITYTCLITSSTGCSASSTTTLTVGTGIAITTQPTGLAVCQDAPATLSVVATGAGLTYQWRKNGVNLLGEIASTLTFASAAVVNSGSYDVVINSACGDPAVTSTAVTLTVNPTPTVVAVANQTNCAGTITAAIPLTGTPSGVTYNITGGAAIGLANQTAVTSIPSFTSVAGIATITVTPNANGCPGTPITYTTNVNALPALTAVTPSTLAVCSLDAPVLLTASGGSTTGTSTIGAGTLTNTASTPYKGFWGGNKTQMLYTAAELTAQGMATGSVISSIAYNINAFSGPYTFNGFTIAMKNTATASLSTTLETGTTTVLASSTLVLTGTAPFTKTHTLSAPFTWDGISNLLVETCFNNADGGGSSANSASVASTTVTAGRSVYYSSDNNPTVCSNPGTATASTTRNNITFGYSSTSAVTWSPVAGLFTDAAGTTPYTGAVSTTVYAKPSTSTTYTAKFTNAAGCFVNNTAAIAVTQAVTLYTDADGDGYSVGTPIAPACYATIPAGFSTFSLGTDCDDTLPGVNSGSTIFTQLKASQCNTLLTTLGKELFADAVSGATSYRIIAKNMTTLVTQTIEKPTTFFRMVDFPLYDYNTVYEITILVQKNGIWYGKCATPCTVTTPNIVAPGVAQLSSVSCNVQLTRTDNPIYSNLIPNVTGYRFRITRPDNSVFVHERVSHWFTLNTFVTDSGVGIVYGATYQVEVAVKTNGVYSGYGSVCTVTAPQVPGLSSCGIVATNKSYRFTTPAMDRVTVYRFELTNTVTSAITYYDSFVNNFNFALAFPGGISLNTVYSVRFAVKTINSTVFSGYGPACSVTSPIALSRGEFTDVSTPTLKIDNTFTAVAYPNPFGDYFVIDVKSFNENVVDVKIYDMIGKLLESKEVQYSEINNQALGQEYPSGVYNVIVSQGENVKTLRVVKK
jgi:GEVED domain/Ig-like domain CHU_C associated/Secretion system C-terminal sorting domain